MTIRRHHESRDRNHNIVIKALQYRCGGMERDKNVGHYYAWLHGMRVAAYDMHKREFGYPDWEVWVSWVGILFEVKPERERINPQDKEHSHIKYDDKEFYYQQLSSEEKKFAASHPGLIAIVHDQNQVYDWLLLVADFVDYVEGKAEGGRELLKLFFPGAVKRASTNFAEMTDSDVILDPSGKGRSKLATTPKSKAIS